jgi:hypothetical protein
MERTQKFFVFMSILWAFSHLTIGCGTDKTGDGASVSGSKSYQISSHQTPGSSLKLPTDATAAISEDPDTDSTSNKKFVGLLFGNQAIGDTATEFWPGSESPPVTPLPPISKAKKLDLDFPEIGLAVSGLSGEIIQIADGTTLIPMVDEGTDTDWLSAQKFNSLLFSGQAIGSAAAEFWPELESPPVTPLPSISKAEELDVDFPEIGLAVSGPIGEINGITSGATVILVADDEMVASEDASEGMSESTEYGDLVDELYAFAFSDIPVLSNIRIYLSIEGEIFPMYFDSTGDGDPDTNVFSLTADTNVSLGYLDINDTDQSGKVVPQFNPTVNPHVIAGPENTDFPDCLNQPDTSELTLDQMVTEGLDALKAGWVHRAMAYFEDAESQTESSISNDADTARFFYALTRVAVLGLESYSKEIQDSCLNTCADILDALSFPAKDTSSATFDTIFLADPLPANFPDPLDLQRFLNEVVVPELEGALNNLDEVSEGFNRQWTEPNNKLAVKSDYRDVQFFEAAFNEALAFILNCLAEFDAISVSMNAESNSQK